MFILGSVGSQFFNVMLQRTLLGLEKSTECLVSQGPGLIACAKIPVDTKVPSGRKLKYHVSVPFNKVNDLVTSTYTAKFTVF